MKKNFLHSLTPVLLFALLHGTSSAQPITQLKSWLSSDVTTRPSFNNQLFAYATLTEREAIDASALLLDDAYRELRAALGSQWSNRAIIEDNDTLKFDYKVFAEKPEEGRSLFISMHGGGNAPPQVNDQQWRNQIGLYKPAEGVYLAPRAPTNTWNLWHESHIDTLFEKLIHAAVLFENVNRDKVYIMGYFAGGDGVYQLAPRMADRLAAAAMMAGHPNETSPLSLRNLPFTIHVGALDNGFKRNEVAGRWSVMLDSPEKLDPGGYTHFVQLHEGRPHWMNREDTVAIPWMMQYRRNTLPDRIVWKQDDMHHVSFYWLATPISSIKTGGEVIASFKGNEINIEQNYGDTLLVRLNDAMMNLDKPITVNYKGKILFKGKVKRNLNIIQKTISDRKDPGLIFSAELVLTRGKITVAN